jgi:23S rRNA (pseudouridine1915-N3)-methyltransferase
MLNIRILCVGKLNERFYTDAANEFVKRLSGYCKLEIIEIREHRLPADPSDAQILFALDKEHTAIQSHLPSSAFIIALCVEGREIDSNELSEMLLDCANRGASRLCFLIGGSFGLHDKTKAVANVKMSLSKMTFPHALARIMLLEQLYRAFSIAHGGKYHK